MYVMVCNRLDITHEVVVLSRYMSIPGKEHKTTVKSVFRYLCGTIDQTIFYEGKIETERKVNVHGFVNSDWAIDVDGRRLTNGYVFNIFGGACSWMSRRRLFIALSTTEVE